MQPGGEQRFRAPRHRRQPPPGQRILGESIGVPEVHEPRSIRPHYDGMETVLGDLVQHERLAWTEQLANRFQLERSWPHDLRESPRVAVGACQGDLAGLVCTVAARTGGVDGAGVAPRQRAGEPPARAVQCCGRRLERVTQIVGERGMDQRAGCSQGLDQQEGAGPLDEPERLRRRGGLAERARRAQPRGDREAERGELRHAQAESVRLSGLEAGERRAPQLERTPGGSQSGGEPPRLAQRRGLARQDRRCTTRSLRARVEGLDGRGEVLEGAIDLSVIHTRLAELAQGNGGHRTPGGLAAVYDALEGLDRGIRIARKALDGGEVQGRKGSHLEVPRAPRGVGGRAVMGARERRVAHGKRQRTEIQARGARARAVPQGQVGLEGPRLEITRLRQTTQLAQDDAGVAQRRRLGLAGRLRRKA